MKLQLLIILFIIPFTINDIFAEEITIENVRITDVFSNIVDIVSVNQQIQFRSDVINNEDTEQRFVYVVFTEGSNSGKLAWITGSLSSDQSFSTSLSFIPETSGTYKSKIMFFEKIESGNMTLLASTHNISFATDINSTITNENDFTFIPDIVDSPYSEFIIDIESTYYDKENIILVGNVSEVPLGIPSVTLVINDEYGQPFYIDSVTIKSDWTYEFSVNSNIFETGNYIFEINSGIHNDSVSLDILSQFKSIDTQSDKTEYYTNEIISINGTITTIDESKDTIISYNVSHSDDTLIQSGENIILNEDGTFDFTISTTGWDFDDYIIVDITFQDSTASTSFNYYNTQNIENEILYSLITENTYTLNTHDTALEEQHYTMESYNNTLNNHDTILTDHETSIDQQHYTMEVYNSTLIIQSQLIENLEGKIKIIDDYLAILNNTLSDEFPSELNGQAIREVVNENGKLEGDIIFLESQIAGDIERLEDAILGGNEIRIKTLQDAIGSNQALILLTQAKLDITEFYTDRYDLLP